MVARPGTWPKPQGVLPSAATSAVAECSLDPTTRAGWHHRESKMTCSGPSRPPTLQPQASNCKLAQDVVGVLPAATCTGTCVKIQPTLTRLVDVRRG